MTALMVVNGLLLVYSALMVPMQVEDVDSM
jgi:hypothetical protein